MPETVRRIGVDTGGTFSDIVYEEDGQISVHKVPSTPKNPADAVINGLRDLKTLDQDKLLTYGTTVATNSLLERKGSRVGFITTEGFEDLLLIARQDRPDIFDLFAKKPKPLVERHMAFGVPERLGPDGSVEKELTAWTPPKELGECSSFAVCLLHSYANPEHEERVGEILRESFPGKPITLSSQILSEYREYERATTATVNAFVAPIMDEHLKDLEKRTAPGRLRVMQSNGGSISAGVARKEPVRTVLSGPAGGVVGAYDFASMCGYDRIITFDMGGTSTDVSLCPGRSLLNTQTSIGGLPVKTPVIDIHTVGAGGGSLAWIDAGGGLQVGPRSAGAVPGPICYNRGGTQVTITDANYFLERLDTDHFLGGEMKLERSLLQEEMGCLGLNLRKKAVETAQGILDIADAKMRRAIMVISVERGYDPRDFTLVSFGGAGGLHACHLAQELGIPRVLVPPNPGVLSAWGMLRADVIKNYSNSVLGRGTDRDYLIDQLNGLKQQAFDDLTLEGFNPNEMKLIATLDVRYKHQSFELEVPFGIDYEQDFNLAHENRYGYYDPEAEVEIVNVRLKAVGVTLKPQMKEHKLHSEDPSAAVLKEKEVVFGEFVPTTLYDRDKLKPGNVVQGPAVIMEYSSTTVVPPGHKAAINKFRGLEISRE